MSPPAADARSDVVGSLLRPPGLLEARRARAEGELGQRDFKRREDAAVDEALRLQERAGLEVVTDGEMRRLSFQSQLVEAVDGFGEWGLDAFLWGEWHGDGEVGDRTVERPDLAVLAPLERRRHLTAEEFTYLRGRTDRVVKTTLPSPSLFASFYDPERAPEAYPDLPAFLEAVADLLVEEVAELARLGAGYVQLDAPHYTMFLDPGYRDWYASRGWPADEWLAFGVELDNRVLTAEPALTTAFHLCRGNQASRWLTAGGYEPLERGVLARVAADRLLLEYDDERSGGFGPLAAVPADTTVVLGLVSTKTGELEDADELLGRLDEASRHVPPGRLAVSTQCGFGTSVLGNALTAGQQRDKLALVSELADRWWA